MERLRVLVSDAVAPEGLERLTSAEALDVVDGTSWSRSELLERIGEFHGLIVRSATQVDAELLEAAESMHVVGRAGVGVDNIDLKAATKRGVVVINSPEGNTVSTAEHTIAMIAGLARSIPQAYAALVRDGVWDRRRFTGVQLAGKVLGVLGLGRVGSEVARRAAAMDMRVMGYDPFINEERARRLGVQLGTVDEICSKADFITVHTPLTKQTEGLVSEPQFQLMKPGVRVINCARGGIIDEKALYNAICAGRVAGAALDVFIEEPPGENPLLSLENVIATPHLGASTHEAQVNVAIDVAESVVKALRGIPVKYAVNAPALRGEGVEGLAAYVDLAERIGHFITGAFGGNFGRIELVYRGKAATFDEAALTAGLLKGMLEPFLHERVNYVNARVLADERDVRLAVTKEDVGDSDGGSITVIGTGGGRTRSVTGVTNGRGAILTEIDGYSVNVEAKGRVLLAYNVDRPGIIGRVGTLLGGFGVNIAYMQVGRKVVGSYAVMVLGIDDPLEERILEELRAQDDLKEVRLVEF